VRLQTGQRPPDPHYSYNSTGAGNEVRHNSTGNYTVVFPGLGVPGGTAHVMAIGYQRSCQLLGWHPASGAAHVRVLCFSPTGEPADTAFTVNFADANRGPARFSFLYSDRPSGGGVHVPDATYRYDSTGGVSTVQRLSAGSYAVAIPATQGIGSTPLESYQVTAVSFQARHCRIVRGVAIDTTRFVQCTDAAGRPADSAFTLTYVVGGDLIGRTAGGFAYAAVADPSSVSGDVPAYSTVGSPASIHVRRMDAGYYIVRIPRLPSYSGHAMIVADSTLPRHCMTYGWSPHAPGDQYVGVSCFDPTTDRQADTAFVIGYSQW